MILGQALMEKIKNREYRKMRKIYGVNDDRTQMAKIKYLQMKDYTHRLICSTLHDHNSMIIQTLKKDGSKKKMFNHIKRLMRKQEQNECQDFKWQWNNCER